MELQDPQETKKTTRDEVRAFGNNWEGHVDRGFVTVLEVVTSNQEAGKNSGKPQKVTKPGPEIVSKSNESAYSILTNAIRFAVV